MGKKDDKEGNKTRYIEKKGKGKKERKKKRIEIRTKKSVLSKFWLMHMPQKPKWSLIMSKKLVGRKCVSSRLEFRIPKVNQFVFEYSPWFKGPSFYQSIPVHFLSCHAKWHTRQNDFPHFTGNFWLSLWNRMRLVMWVTLVCHPDKAHCVRRTTLSEINAEISTLFGLILWRKYSKKHCITLVWKKPWNLAWFLGYVENCQA